MPEFGEVAVTTHVASHQDGGADELIVTDLSGELADTQPSTWTKVASKPSTFDPTSHASDHENGGGDDVDVTDLSGVLADKQDANKLQGRDVVSTAPSDGQALVWDDGNSRWAPATPAGYTVVHDETLTVAATYVEATSLDLDADGFWEIYLMICNGVAEGIAVYMYVNNDLDGGHYRRQYLAANDGGITADRLTSAGLMAIDANDFAFYHATMAHEPSGEVVAMSTLGREPGTGVRLEIHVWCTEGDVANVTTLRFTASVADGLGIGSRFIILRPPL